MAERKDRPTGGMTVQEAGRKGGQRVLRQRGPEYFSRIGRKGGQKVRELIQAGKRGAGREPRPPTGAS